LKLTGRKYILHLRSVNNKKCALTGSKRAGNLASNQIVPKMFKSTPNVENGSIKFTIVLPYTFQKVIVLYMGTSYEKSTCPGVSIKFRQ